MLEIKGRKYHKAAISPRMEEVDRDTFTRFHRTAIKAGARSVSIEGPTCILQTVCNGFGLLAQAVYYKVQGEQGVRVSYQIRESEA